MEKKKEHIETQHIIQKQEKKNLKQNELLLM
jgi:hypothetical protein